MKRGTKHAIASRFSFGSVSITINGQSVVQEGALYGRVTCSCGWDSGNRGSGEAAAAEFEHHKAQAAKPRRRT